MYYIGIDAEFGQSMLDCKFGICYYKDIWIMDAHQSELPKHSNYYLTADYSTEQQ